MLKKTKNKTIEKKVGETYFKKSLKIGDFGKQVGNYKKVPGYVLTG